MAPRRLRHPLTSRPRPRIVVTALALVAGAGFVIWSPLLMYRLLGESLPWVMLANVGEAYGGASALLSAAALSGIGASLFLQSRQMRQELMSLDKQRHFELVKLALENPEFFEILDGGPLDARDGKKRIYANLTLTYWLTMWELDEIGEAELRTLTATMFKSGVSRNWWREVNGYWITVRGRRRRQFMCIVDGEWASADARAQETTATTECPAVPIQDRSRSDAGNEVPRRRSGSSPGRWSPSAWPSLIYAACELGGAVKIAVLEVLDERGESRPSERQDSTAGVLRISEMDLYATGINPHLDAVRRYP